MLHEVRIPLIGSPAQTGHWRDNCRNYVRLFKDKKLLLFV